MSHSEGHHQESAAAGHGAEGHKAHDMHLGLYWTIGGILLLFTVITVALSYFDFGSRMANIIVAMVVATFKVSLVGAIFMHLKGEKPVIWRFLYFTVIFAAGLFLLTALHWANPIWGTTHNLH